MPSLVGLLLGAEARANGPELEPEPVPVEQERDGLLPRGVEFAGDEAPSQSESESEPDVDPDAMLPEALDPDALTLPGIDDAPPTGQRPGPSRTEVDALVPPSLFQPGDRDELERDSRERVLKIEAIRIVGREQVSPKQIARILRSEGLSAGKSIMWPRDDRVERARGRLRATGYFERVILKVEPVEGSESRVVLVVDLEEKSSVRLGTIYLGSSRMTPFRTGISIAEQNFLGRAVHLGGAFIWGTLPRIEDATRQQAYKAFAEVPRIGRAPVGLAMSAYVLSASEPYRVTGEEDDPDPDLFRAVNYSRAGGLFGLTFPLMPSLTIATDYRIEWVVVDSPDEPVRVEPDGSLEPVDLHLRNGSHRLATLHFGLQWDGRSDTFLVGKGGRFALDLQMSSPALGSSYEYVKLVAGGAYTFRLPWRHWITPKVQGGQIAGAAPRFELFYAGDLSAWTPGREQGLIYSTRNPIDVFGTGIDTQTFGVLFGRVDLEYVIPLFRRTRTRVVYGGDLFFSAGVFTLAEERSVREARRDAGEFAAPIGFNADFGLRLDTSVGTFNISVGNVLRRVPL